MRECQFLVSTRFWYKECNHSVSVCSLKHQRVYIIVYVQQDIKLMSFQGEMCAEGKVAQRAEIQPIANKAYLELKK